MADRSNVRAGIADRLAGLVNTALRRADGLFKETEARLLIAEQARLVRFQENRLRELLDRHPKEPVVWREMALVMHEEAKWGELVAFSENIRRHFPNLAFGYRIGASALYQRGDIDAAEALAHRAMVRFPLNPDSYFTYAECAEKRGDLPEAMARRRLIVRKFPAAKWSHHGLIVTLLRARAFDEAEQAYQAAAPLFARDKDILAIGARVAEARKDHPEAAARWEALLGIDGRDSVAHQGVIAAWTAAGNTAEARAATERRDFLFPNR